MMVAVHHHAGQHSRQRAACRTVAFSISLAILQQQQQQQQHTN
jgi:hypothetical protein